MKNDYIHLKKKALNASYVIANLGHSPEVGQAKLFFSVAKATLDLGKVSKKILKNGVGLLQPLSVYLPTPFGVQ